MVGPAMVSGTDMDAPGVQVTLAPDAPPMLTVARLLAIPPAVLNVNVPAAPDG